MGANSRSQLTLLPVKLKHNGATCSVGLLSLQRRRVGLRGDRWLDAIERRQPLTPPPPGEGADLPLARMCIKMTDQHLSDHSNGARDVHDGAREEIIMSGDVHEVYAIRYGHHDRRSPANFVG